MKGGEKKKLNARDFTVQIDNKIMANSVILLALLIGLLSTFGLAVVTPDNFDDKEVKSLSMPTDFAFLPGGQMLVSTKDGKIHIMQNPLDLNSGITEVLNIEDRICTNGERGVNSILVDPDFDSNRFVYVYYTWNVNNYCGTDTSDTPVNRLSRYRLNDDFKFDEDSEIKLFQTDPVIKQYHNGGGTCVGQRWKYLADHRRWR